MHRIHIALSLICAIVMISNLVGAMKKVIVTGAGGRTGSLVFKKLLSSPDYEPLAVVRTPKSLKQLLKKTDATAANVIVADVTDTAALESCFAGSDAVILCTSAVPKIRILSLIKVLFAKLVRKSARPTFTFAPNGDPYNVDYLGAVNQVKAAKKAGVKKFVFLSSMGGTQPDNFLNSIGKIDGDDKSGNILLWKRKAEMELVSSGMDYTIVHPGGLTDKPGGKSEVILGVDDELLKREVRSIPREDVAEVCVQALAQPGASKRSIDIIATVSEDGSKVTKDWRAFFSTPGNCKY